MQILGRNFIIDFAQRPLGSEFLGKLDRIGLLINGGFQDSKSLGLQLRIKSTQNLSGELAVRSSSENQHQAQYLASVLADQSFLAVRQRNGKFRRFPGDLGCLRNAEPAESQKKSRNES